MYPRKEVLARGHAAQRSAARPPVNLQRPQVAQPKTATAPQTNKRPAAPPVYRPQPATKTAQPKSVNTERCGKHPSPPPAYRPQPVPKVLQPKTAAQAPKPAKAPPVYRPEPKKIVQPKTAAAKAPGAPKPPPAYRPQPAPRVLQTKQSQTGAAHARGLRPAHKDRGAVQRRRGLVRPASQGAAIQRYTLIDKPKGQLSEHKNILLTSGTSNVRSQGRTGR